MSRAGRQDRGTEITNKKHPSVAEMNSYQFLLSPRIPCHGGETRFASVKTINTDCLVVDESMQFLEVYWLPTGLFKDLTYLKDLVLI